MTNIKDTIKKGDIFHTDSNLGGVFEIKYTGKIDPTTGRYIFKNISSGFEGAEYKYLPEDLDKKLISKI